MLVIPLLSAVGLDTTYIVQKSGQLYQLRDGQSAADLQGSDGEAQIFIPTERGAAIFEQAGQGVLRLCLCQSDLFDIGGGQKKRALLLAGRGVSLIRQELQYFRIFQSFENLCIHGCLPNLS